MAKKNETAAEWVDIQTLNPWEENPRNNQDAIPKVADSIRRFGFASPIIARKEDNSIIAGHTRYAAALTLGLEKVPVRFMDLDPADAKLLAIADNKIGEAASWDFVKMKDVFESLGDITNDIETIGFTKQEFDAILESDFDFSFDKGAFEERYDNYDENEDSEEEEEAALRVLQLYLEDEDFVRVQSMLHDIAKDLGTDNNTDTIVGLIQNAHANL